MASVGRWERTEGTPEFIPAAVWWGGVGAAVALRGRPELGSETTELRGSLLDRKTRLGVLELSNDGGV